MRVIPLQSGSNGNSVYIESGDVRLLIDAGISGKQVERRLGSCGVDVEGITALLVSHDHSDHVRCMGVYHRKFKIPVYVTRPTLVAARRRARLGMIDEICNFTSGATLEFGSVKVETVPTPHDSADGVGFIVDDGQARVGILTDLGHVFPGLESALHSLDAVLLESNYDSGMLEGGPYPDFLKQRIRGPGGHLSNLEAAILLSSAFRRRLQWACLSHLSEQNNAPVVALQTHRKIVGDDRPLCVASRYEVSEVLEI